MEYMIGNITLQTKQYFILEVNDIGYQVFGNLGEGNKIMVYIQKIINIHDNSQVLYGFKDQKSKIFFNNLINIKGVGAGSVIKLMNSYGLDEIKALQNNGQYLQFTNSGVKMNILAKICHNNSNQNEDIKYIKKTLKSFGFKLESINNSIETIYNVDFELDVNLKNIIRQLNAVHTI